MASYGDDFTGSSENLAQFHRSGLRSKLYLRLPTVEGLLQDAKEFHILGIAGTARAMNSDVMEGEIGPAFALLAKLDCAFLQYKICSTFDSSEMVGSFGRALELSRAYLGHRRTAVLAATPDFGRYTAFGPAFCPLRHVHRAVGSTSEHVRASSHPDD